MKSVERQFIEAARVHLHAVYNSPKMPEKERFHHLHGAQIHLEIASAIIQQGQRANANPKLIQPTNENKKVKP